jgi:hypothetical protein
VNAGQSTTFNSPSVLGVIVATLVVDRLVLFCVIRKESEWVVSIILVVPCEIGNMTVEIGSGTVFGIKIVCTKK